MIPRMFFWSFGLKRIKSVCGAGVGWRPVLILGVGLGVGRAIDTLPFYFLGPLPFIFFISFY